MRKDSRAPRSAWKRISSGGVVLALVALFGLPTAAFAAATTVTLAGNPGTVTVTSDGSANAVTVSSSALYVNVVDTAAGVTPGAGCAVNPVNPNGVRCAIPSNGITVINVNLAAGNDTLQASGTDAPMVINGGDGDDTLNGGQQNDTLNGGIGDDTLDGKDGADALNGDANAPGLNPKGDTASYIGTINRNVSLDGVGNDGATAENDNVNTENVTTAGGADTLTGDANANALTSGAGIDSLNGAGGDDTLNGGSAADNLVGSTGVDTVSYNPESRAVSVTADDVADDGPDIDSVTPGIQPEGDNVHSDIESIAGGSGNDFLVGGTGAGTITGNGGNDTLNGGNDVLSDTINGGSGLDTVSYAGRVAAVNVSLDGVANDGAAGEFDNVQANVERATGGGGSDTLTGNASINILNGGGGADTLNGGDNNDTLIGGAGADTFNGGSGTGDLADYSAAGGAVTVTIGVGAGNDGEAADNDTVNATVEYVTGGAFADDITGDASNNRLNGGLGNDTLRGGAGNDTLNGQDGNDTLNGEDGNDTLSGGLGADDINGGNGSGDTTTYAGRATGVNVNMNVANGDGEAGENDYVRPNVERVTGTSHDDTITGETGAAISNPNIFNGGDGDDTLRGGDGNDTVNGGNGNDLVVGNLGTDSLVGGAGADDLRGAPDTNVTHPNGYKDNLNCGTGVDTNVHDTLDFVGASCE